jgi:entericidin B
LKKFVLLLLALSAFMAGCNTMRGLGQDIEKGGEAIQRGATK